MTKQRNRITSASSSRPSGGGTSARKRSGRRGSSAQATQSNGKQRKTSRSAISGRVKAPIDAVRDADSSAARSVASVSIPAILIGAGVTWLLFQNPSIRSSGLMRRARRLILGIGNSLGEEFSGAVGQSVETVQGAAGTFGRSFRTAADSVRTGLSMLASQAQTGASVVSQAVRYGADSARRTASGGIESTRDFASDLWREHPLPVSAAVLAAGVTAGMLLPASAPEQRIVGETAAKVTRTIRRGGERLLREGKQLAGESAGAALREARRQGLAPSELGRRVKRVVSKATNAVVSSGD
jgi:hypothetical protein